MSEVSDQVQTHRAAAWRRTDAQIAGIIATVAAGTGTTPRAIRSMLRPLALVDARHIAMWITRRVTQFSYPAIGRAFGDRDHTTIMHAVARIDRRMATDGAFAEHVLELLDQAAGDRS